MLFEPGIHKWPKYKILPNKKSIITKKYAMKAWIRQQPSDVNTAPFQLLTREGSLLYHTFCWGQILYLGDQIVFLQRNILACWLPIRIIHIQEVIGLVLQIQKSFCYGRVAFHASQVVFLPLAKKQEVVLHPVKQWKIGRCFRTKRCTGRIDGDVKVLRFSKTIVEALLHNPNSITSSPFYSASTRSGRVGTKLTDRNDYW